MTRKRRIHLYGVLSLLLMAGACGDSESGADSFSDPNNAPPIARLDVPVRANVGDTILLDASASTDPDGEIVIYLFSIDGPPFLQSRSPALAHTFTEAGDVMVAVTVIDDQGTKATERTTIFVSP